MPFPKEKRRILGSCDHPTRFETKSKASESGSRVSCSSVCDKRTAVSEVKLYYRRFISHFAKIAAPLHALTQKDAGHMSAKRLKLRP